MYNLFFTILNKVYKIMSRSNNSFLRYIATEIWKKLDKVIKNCIASVIPLNFSTYFLSACFVISVEERLCDFM